MTNCSSAVPDCRKCTAKLSLVAELDNEIRVCLQCQRMCNIAPGKTGFCKTVKNEEGTLYTLIYGLISSSGIDPIEKKPLYHFFPGSRCFSVGSLGCNFRCSFCQNWQIAYAEPDSNLDGREYYLSPEDLVQTALANNCTCVAWTYNEPSIWYEYTLESAKLCKEAGLYTVYVTNGFATREHIDGIGPYLDAYRVDIKSMDKRFYMKMASVNSIDGILENTRRAKEKWNMHVECVTNLVPGENDTDQDIANIASWISDNLGADTPWHVTRFFPNADMTDTAPTPISTLQKAMQIGKDKGLQFVYPGNVNMPGASDTHCPECGELLVSRAGYSTRTFGLSSSGNCKCGCKVNIRL